MTDTGGQSLLGWHVADVYCFVRDVTGELAEVSFVRNYA